MKSWTLYEIHLKEVVFLLRKLEVETIMKNINTVNIAETNSTASVTASNSIEKIKSLHLFSFRNLCFYSSIC